MDFIKKHAGVLAVIAIVIAIITFSTSGKTKFGQIVDTSFFDYFDATTGYKLAGVTFLNATSFSLPTGVTAQTINGVTTTYKHTALTLATTTPCSLLLPSATTTTLSTSINIVNASTTAAVVTIATSTTAYASTTPLMTFALAASSQNTFQFTPTTTAMAANQPATYLNWTVQGGNGPFLTNSGFCNAVVVSAN